LAGAEVTPLCISRRGVDLAVPTPELAQEYYEICALIDRHNRCRHDDFKLETKVLTKLWNSRVKLSFFGVIVVDTWKVYRGCREPIHGFKDGDHDRLYLRLAEMLIEKNHDDARAVARRAARRETEAEAEHPVFYPEEPRTTPTKKTKKKNGHDTKQATCISEGCTKRTTHVCNECLKETGCVVFVCSQRVEDRDGILKQ